MSVLIDGKKVSQEIKDELKVKVDALKSAGEKSTWIGNDISGRKSGIAILCLIKS